MDRVEWLDRSLRVLSKHYGKQLIIAFEPDPAKADPCCEIWDDEWATLIGAGADLPSAVEAGIHGLTNDQLLVAETETRRSLMTKAVMTRMGYPEATPEEQVALRLNGFAQEVHALVEASEELKIECAGVCIGYGLGAIMALGATEAQLRDRCDQIIRGLVDGAAAIVAHEKKTFS